MFGELMESQLPEPPLSCPLYSYYSQVSGHLCYSLSPTFILPSCGNTGVAARKMDLLILLDDFSRSVMGTDDICSSVFFFQSGCWRVRKNIFILREHSRAGRTTCCHWVDPSSVAPRNSGLEKRVKRKSTVGRWPDCPQIGQVWRTLHVTSQQ